MGLFSLLWEANQSSRIGDVESTKRKLVRRVRELERRVAALEQRLDVTREPPDAA